MTDLQDKLIATLEGRQIVANFSSNRLVGFAEVKIKGKAKRQRFVIEFDDAINLDGPRVAAHSGNYGEAFARDAFFEALRIGQGDEAAALYDASCREIGLRSGAPQSWIDANGDRSM